MLPWQICIFLGWPLWCSLAGLEVPLVGAMLVAGVEKIRFDLEADVEQQPRARPLPFLGMDRKLKTGSCGIFEG